MKLLSAIISIFLLGSLGYLMFGKLGIPDGMTAVTGFDVNRYTGTWYEIARLDHGFEKGLTHVTAEFTPKDDGGLKVINKGFDTKSQRWQTSEAKAYFLDTPDIGRLKVSFFGPFYGSYNIIDLDQQNYSWALVTGPSTHFLWLLARTRTVDNTVMQRLIDKAKTLGFKLEKLVYVDQKEGTAPPDVAPVTPPPAQNQ